MSNLQKLKSILMEFLTDDNPWVLAIKWEWGSGKTYFWNDFLESQDFCLKDTYENYSYCSLFWENDIELIKKKIFYNQKRILGIQTESYKQTKKWAGFLANKVQKIDKSTIWKAIDITTEIYSDIQFMTMNRYLICFDDFERIGKIDIHTFLGLISELKENKKCKIILIFNDAELSKDVEVLYVKFREKIIDMEIEFNPSEEECAQIVFRDFSDNKSNDFVLYKNSIKLQIKNIRILRKIHAISRKLYSELKKYNNDDIIKNMLSSVSLLVYCYYWNFHNSEDSKIPSLQYVKDYEAPSLFSDKKENLPHEEVWMDFLREYGWIYTDDFDRIIIEVISRWYVNFSNYEYWIIQKKIDSYVKGNIEERYAKIWENIFHAGFIDNENDFVKEMLKVFNEGSWFLHGRALNEVVTIMRELQRLPGEITGLIECFIEGNKDFIDKLNINEIVRHSINPIDTEIRDKFRAKYNEHHGLKNMTLKALLDRTIEQWQQRVDGEFEHIVFRTTEDEIYRLFQEAKGQNFHKYRYILLYYKNVSNPDKEWIDVTQKTINALKKFNTCKINEVRLRAYEII